MRVRVITRLQGSAGTTLRAALQPESLLMAAGQRLLAGVEHAFQQEGPGWAPLRPRTVREREREGVGGRRPILQRTGGLRRSFKAVIDGNTLLIESHDPRAAILQREGPNRRARPIVIPSSDVLQAVRAVQRMVSRA